MTPVPIFWERASGSPLVDRLRVIESVANPHPDAALLSLLEIIDQIQFDLGDVFVARPSSPSRVEQIDQLLDEHFDHKEVGLGIGLRF